MYGVLYALSPELFPSPVRGTGNAVVAVANRVFGIMVGASHPPAKIMSEAMLMLRLGPHRCSLRRSYNECANICERGFVPRSRSSRTAPSIRASRKGCTVDFCTLSIIVFYIYRCVLFPIFQNIHVANRMTLA